MTEQRLTLIKERVAYLEKVKKEGLNLSRRYKVKDIVVEPVIELPFSAHGSENGTITLIKIGKAKVLPPQESKLIMGVPEKKQAQQDILKGTYVDFDLVTVFCFTKHHTSNKRPQSQGKPCLMRCPGCGKCNK